jgi:hypothetical protein
MPRISLGASLRTLTRTAPKKTAVANIEQVGSAIPHLVEHRVGDRGGAWSVTSRATAPLPRDTINWTPRFTLCAGAWGGGAEGFGFLRDVLAARLMSPSAVFSRPAREPFR